MLFFFLQFCIHSQHALSFRIPNAECYCLCNKGSFNPIFLNIQFFERNFFLAQCFNTPSVCFSTLPTPNTGRTCSWRRTNLRRRKWFRPDLESTIFFLNLKYLSLTPTLPFRLRLQPPLPTWVFLCF